MVVRSEHSARLARAVQQAGPRAERAGVADLDEIESSRLYGDSRSLDRGSLYTCLSRDDLSRLRSCHGTPNDQTHAVVLQILDHLVGADILNETISLVRFRLVRLMRCRCMWRSCLCFHRG